MNYDELAESILKNVGGDSNVKNIINCFTRVRIDVKDKSLVNDEAIKNLEKVQGTHFSSNQYQVIMGGECSNTCEALLKIAKINKEESGGLSGNSIGAKIMDYISGTINPMLPVLVAAGVVQGLVVLLAFLGVDQTGDTYKILSIMGNAGYYFLPVILGYSAAKKLGCNPYISVAIACVLIHPDLIGMVNTGETYARFLGIPLRLINYNTSITPIMLSVPVIYFVEKFFKKYSPKILTTVLVPTLTLLVSTPLILIITAPIATVISSIIGIGVEFLYNDTSIFGGLIIGAIAPFLVLTGLHNAAVVPVMLLDLERSGFTLLFPILAFSNLSVGGTALGIALKTKNKNFKATSFSAALLGAIGITEPALYGTLLPARKPMIATGIVSAAAGIFSLIFRVKAYGLGLAGLGGIPLYLGDTFIYFLIIGLASYFGSALLAYIIGFKEVEM